MTTHIKLAAAILGLAIAAAYPVSANAQTKAAKHAAPTVAEAEKF